MFGYTPDECLAMENFPAALVEPEDVARTIRQIRQALRGNAGQDFEFRARRKDGSLLWGAADWRPIHGSRNEYLGIRISIRDVSQRREAELRLACSRITSSARRTSTRACRRCSRRWRSASCS
jgi:PAS domain S-box-containing protein